MCCALKKSDRRRTGKGSDTFKPPHDKTNKMTVRPAKTQISLGIRPVWSESSLSAWRKLGPLASYWALSEDSDQTGRMPRLIWVFDGRTCHFVGFVTRWLDWCSITCEIDQRSSKKIWRNTSSVRHWCLAFASQKQAWFCSVAHRYLVTVNIPIYVLI